MMSINALRRGVRCLLEGQRILRLPLCRQWSPSTGWSRRRSMTALTTNQIGDLPMPFWPGRGFGLGITVLKDPIAAQTPESVGTWRMGGTYGHSWFVDPVRQLSVVAFTNTALEGMSGAFVGEICQAVYAATGAMQCA